MFLKVESSSNEEGWIFLLVGWVTSRIRRIQDRDIESERPSKNRVNHFGMGLMVVIVIWGLIGVIRIFSMGSYMGVGQARQFQM